MDSTETTATNGQKTAYFLQAIDVPVKNSILSNIASHYGITRDEAWKEVTHHEAEHLCDYVTGPERAAVSLLMKKHRLA